ncbi:hypothetical protein [Nocardia transvalensis]|uniref:hypothetical protein n=1 Tax=Nocardia transvalensis TaxID=37333 RepID=UPI001895C9D3|nr:hypothetical protein [Nocardia transvalensis]MBF6328712.1 hypothetical protein [Nocardia transvalensis]
MSSEQSQQIPNDGPWIKLSMCGVGSFNGKTGELVKVMCPSRFCLAMAPLIDGKIGEHDAALPVGPGRCPWLGVRVVNDEADFIGNNAPQKRPIDQ